MSKEEILMRTEINRKWSWKVRKWVQLANFLLETRWISPGSFNFWKFMTDLQSEKFLCQVLEKSLKFILKNVYFLRSFCCFFYKLWTSTGNTYLFKVSNRDSQKLWNMFEVSNKDTRVTSFLLLNLNILHLFYCF